MFQKGPGKTKASHQPKAEMEANEKKKAKEENIWTADTNSDVSDSLGVPNFYQDPKTSLRTSRDG